MENIAFVCGVLGIILSILGISLFTYREYKIGSKRTLSDLAAKNSQTLRQFRVILIVCGILISIMVYFLLIPNMASGKWLFIFYTMILFCELSLAIFPAGPGMSGRIHDALAYSMGFGMLGLAISFALILNGGYSVAEYVILGLMISLCLISLKFWDYMILFELPFIFLSHMSILLAAIAVS